MNPSFASIDFLLETPINLMHLAVVYILILRMHSFDRPLECNLDNIAGGVDEPLDGSLLQDGQRDGNLVPDPVQ